jgi:hypothetical protein
LRKWLASSSDRSYDARHPALGRWQANAPVDAMRSQREDQPVTRSVTWATLSRPARAYRVFHASWSVAGLASLGYVWACAATRRRDRILAASVAFLSVEGVGLIIGRGDCPMGQFQSQLGDPVPFFELVLPPRAAMAAVPILGGASIAAILTVVLRPPTPTSPADNQD